MARMPGWAPCSIIVVPHPWHGAYGRAGPRARRQIFADSHIVDDWDPSLQWNGGWTGFKGEPAPTWDRTLTWGNISSATVTFTFTGTSIQVFGAFKPVGIWSMQSQYAIDGGSPTTFVPPQQVSAEAYNQSFYHSGTLSAGEHTLKITNLGSQLWLDYFLVNDDGGVNVVSAGGPSVGASTATTTATVIESPTPTPVPSAGLTSASTGSSAASTSSAQSLPTQLNVSVSTTNSSTPSTTSPSASGSSDSSLSSPLASSPSSSPTSSDATSPARGAEATQDPSSGASHTVSPGLIAGVTLGGLAVLAILLAVWWRVRRKQRGLAAWVAPYPFSRPPGPDASSRTETSFYAHDASLRESQYSATLLIGPRASRRASSLADLVDSYSYAHGQPSPHSPYSPQSPHAHQSPHSPYNPYTDRSPHSAYGGYLSSVRRSTDGGVTIAGGPGVDGGGDAPSISDVQSIKSRLPPVYQAYGAAGRSG